jgi:O-antigen/teichoic acid export membrane protein
MEFRKIAAIDFVSYGIGYGLLGVCLAFLGYGVWALVWAHVANVALNTALIVRSKPGSIGVAMKIGDASSLLGFGIGLSLARVANYVATQADNVIVGRSLGAEALGFYGRAYQCLMMPANFFGSVFDKVLFPAMVAVQDDKERLGRAFARSLGIVAMLTLPLSGVLIVLAPEIIELLLGPEWMPVVTPFRVLCTALALRTGYKIGHTLCRAVGAVYEIAWRETIYAAAVVLGAGVGLSWGMLGVAVGVSAAMTLNFVLTFHLVTKVAETSWPEMLLVYGRNLILAVAVALCAGAIKAAAQLGGTHPALILIFTCIGSCTAMVVACVSFHRLLGEENVWLQSLARAQLRTIASRLGIALP